MLYLKLNHASIRSHLTFTEKLSERLNMIDCSQKVAPSVDDFKN